MRITRFLITAALAVQCIAPTAVKAQKIADDAAWKANAQARETYFEKQIGKPPKDILKMMNMTGVWPGGGLYVIPATRLGKDLAAYTTFGLSNVDMPATVQMSSYQSSSDGNRATGATATLQKKTPAPQRPGAAGYGYEIIVLAAKDQEWPLAILQWAVQAEIINDVGMLNRVEKYDGLTIEKIDVGGGRSVNLLFAKAVEPLPKGTALPGGSMTLLVATAITDEEMGWSRQHGRGALLSKLMEAGVGQVSKLDRASVVR